MCGIAGFELAANVPVGVFLSSGIDSSLILDSAVRGGIRPVAFTIGFRGTERHKRGFAVPLGSLFRGPWHEPAVAWLKESSSCLLDPREVAEALSNDRLHPASTWALCTLIAWEDRLARIRSARPAVRGSSAAAQMRSDKLRPQVVSR